MSHDEAESPRTWPFLLLAFTEGAAVMVAELVGAKMLAPLYGHSLHVWGAVIGVTLVSLACGYYLGGVLSARASRAAIARWLMAAAGLLIVAMPAVAHALLTGLGNLEPTRAILLATACYLAPPLLLLGATPPLLIAVLASGVHDSGKVAGQVYAVSTVGGILATFGVGFWTLPAFGLARTAAAAGIGLSVLPVLWLVRHGRWSALLQTVLVTAVALAPGTEGNHPDVEILYESEGLLGQLKVVDIHGGGPGGTRRTDRVLFVNRTGQTWIDRESGQAQWLYVGYLQTMASLAPPGARVLLLGLGGGVVAKRLQKLDLIVDSVELDERIAGIARDYFGLEQNGDVFVDDGRHFLRSTERRYDLVIFDVYQAEVPPAHLLTLEAFRDLRRVLTPNGFVVVNYSGFVHGPAGLGTRSIVKTLRAADYEVALLRTGPQEQASNVLFVATQGPFDFSAPRLPIMVNGRPQSASAFFLNLAQLDLEDAVVLYDNHQLLEKLNVEAAAVWRHLYYESFTKPFLDKGIPLFR